MNSEQTIDSVQKVLTVISNELREREPEWNRIAMSAKVIEIALGTQKGPSAQLLPEVGRLKTLLKTHNRQGAVLSVDYISRHLTLS